MRLPDASGDWHILETTRVLGTTREVAGSDTAAEPLDRQRSLFELIIENTSEGIIVVDKELRHLVWNPAIESINGQPRSAVLGRTVFEAFPEFSDHPVGRAWRDAVAGRRAEMRDYRFFSQVRGAEVIYDADFTPLFDERDAIIGAICILRETTERHRIEHLSRLETVAQLTGGVAHDFNNLLTAAMGCLDLIVREDANRRVTALAETALRSIDRGARLTEQLLAFARRQALQPVAADLNALLRELEALIRRAADETIEVVIDPAPALPRCELDPAQFEAAVMNLVINARDAMPNGGCIRLSTRRIATAEIPADIERRPGDYLALTVADNGAGMTPEVAARAFEPFFTTKDIGKGSGLGLSMVYGFAKQSGGGVEIDTGTGAGTRITLYLPCASLPGENRQEPDGAKRQHGAGTILLVEDDAAVRDVSLQILESLGYRVLVAGDGRGALRLLGRPDRINLLFADMVMPGGISGIQLARQAQQVRPGLPVLLTTGHAGLDGPADGGFPIILKPFRAAELSRAIARLVSNDLPEMPADPPR